MKEYRYTVREIDDLRRVHTDLVEDGYCTSEFYDAFLKNRQSEMMRWKHSEKDTSKIVEERIRTSMLAGHTAEDIKNNERENVRLQTSNVNEAMGAGND